MAGQGSHHVPLQILFEDHHVLAVAKPARVLTAGDDTGDETLLAMAREYHSARQAPGKKGYLAPLHFLDRPVSGVVLFALSSKAAARVTAQFRERRITKVYWAIVEGEPAAGEGVVLGDWLLKDPETNVTTAVTPGTPGAKASRLSYRLLARRGDLSLIEVRPETGRSHQIRVQLASRGLPIFGDRKYGAASSWDGMIALHALTVTFAHPVGKHPVSVAAPLPASWRGVWPSAMPGGVDVQEA
jgi:23S rRNA pseudouridine1911/1915/1917 synthase